MRLTVEQRQAIEIEGNVCLVSCPGSGKTRVIIAKLIYCVDVVRGTTRKVGCITHTNAAADEIDARIRSSSFGNDDDLYEVSTIHSFCLKHILRPFYHLLPVLKDGYTILTQDAEEFKDKVDELITKYDLRAKDKQLFEQINRSPNGSPYQVQGLSTQLMVEWCKWCDDNAYVCLNDIVYFASKLIEYNHIARGLASKFAFLLVDEFQDTSPGQIRILYRIHSYGKTKFFCVGDPNQSIYRFAGATPTLLTKFAESTGASLDVRLTGNFRCSQRIVNCAENLLPTVPPMMAVGEHIDFVETPQRIHADSTNDAIFTHFLPKLKEHNIEIGNAAILAPWWFSLYKVAKELRAQGIPVVGPGARPYKRSNQVAQLMEAIGAYLESPEPEIVLSVQRALYILLTNLVPDSTVSVYDFKGRVILCEILKVARQARSKYEYAVEWVIEATRAFARVLIEAEAIGDSEADSLIESASRMAEDIASTKENENLKVEDLGIFARPKLCLQLMTIHKAKGREFDAVAIIDAHDGRIPHFSVEYISDQTEKDEQIAESLRVLYVALTRAKKVLMVFTDGSDTRNRPCRFLDQIGFSS